MQFQYLSLTIILEVKKIFLSRFYKKHKYFCTGSENDGECIADKRTILKELNESTTEIGFRCSRLHYGKYIHLIMNPQAKSNADFFDHMAFSLKRLSIKFKTRKKSTQPSSSKG